MNDAPSLTPELVRSKAESIFSQERRRFAALLEGTGESDRVHVGEVAVDIVPTRCEIELRREMDHRQQREGVATVYLVDWLPDYRLPLDLKARVAEGKLYRIGREERLRQVFQAKRLGRDLVRSPLARLAERGDVAEFPASPRLTLDLELACYTWVEQVLGPRLSRTSPTEADFIAACKEKSGADLAARAGEDELWQKWLGHVARLLHDTVSPLSGVVWLAWLAGELAFLPAVLWVREGLVAETPHPSDERLVRKVVEQQLPRWGARAMELAVTPDGSTVDAWDGLLRDAEASRTPSKLDQLVAEIGDPELFAASCRMPQGLARREEVLARALQDLLDALEDTGAGAERWQAVRSAFALLGAHRSVHEARKQSLHMLERLAAWLWSTRHEPVVPAGNPVPVAMLLAQRYASEGGYLDWARRLSGPESCEGVLGEAWKALRLAVEERRDRQEKAFAAGMQAWAESRRPPDGCVPIEHASRELVAGFLQGTPEGAAERRLLVLLMDGMSWARCQELCADLSKYGWDPVKWRPRGWKHLDMPPVLAAFPTVTSVSRAAFFAGALPEPGPELRTTEDPARWRRNAAVQPFASAKGSLPLFLKDRMETEGGRPSAEVLEAIADEDQPLVAAVVNTIDDAIKGTPSLEFTTGTIEIKPLRELLAKARAAGRAVLLVADHGHVLGERMERLDRRFETGGARWRASDGSDVGDPAEIRLAPPGAWAPDPDGQVMLLWGERTQYNVHASHGEHGGLSLAEVVAPAVLLGTAELGGEGEEASDPELATVPMPEPAWWSPGEWRAGAVAGDKPEKPRPRTGSLFGDLPPVDAEAPPPRPSRSTKIPPRWVATLEKSDAFQAGLRMAPVPAKDRDRLARQSVTVCTVLVEHGGRAPSRTVAQALAVSLPRLDGVMSRVISVLNAEGETCISQDRAADSVVLDLERFRRLFGVSWDG